MNVDGTIKLKSALELLKKRYEREYATRYTDVVVSFDTEVHTQLSTDWGGFNEYDTYYEIYACIFFKKNIGGVVVEGCISKNASELAKDLLDELSKTLIDDEFELSSVNLPRFETKTIDLKDDVTIWFNDKEKNKKLVK